MGRFSETEVNDVVGKLVSYQSWQEITQAELAKRMNISETTLSQVINGRYSGDRDAHIRIALQFLKRESERVSVPALGKFVETSIAEQILGVCEDNHAHGTIGLILGPAGKGKTCAIKEYARREANVIFVSAATWSRTPSSMAEAIAKILIGKQHFPNNTQRCLAIVEQIAGRSVLLVVDEAHQLRQDCFDFLRNIWDHANQKNGDARFGMLLSATDRLKTELYSARTGYMYEQFTSRVNLGSTITLDQPFSREDIRKVFDPSLLHFEMDDSAIDWLLSVANSRQKSLRDAVAYVLKAQKVGIKRNIGKGFKIGVDQLRKMEQLMLAAA